ncbi:MAG: CaiB/BaiF CoA-transferase family protein [Rhizobiaceae bacterium]
MPKPLEGIKVVEIASIGPGPFAAMMLADHGADVIRIEKPGGRDIGMALSSNDPMLRGRRKVELDLKKADDVTKALALIAKADVLIEGFRPGVAERLGVGPEPCHARNPALVYGRMTGWGQDGPLALRAGHDINYIAVTGALDAIGTKSSGPMPPMNLVGDFGGGGMLMAYGISAALLPAKISGRGTVVDAAMVDGTALLMMMPFALKAQGLWDGGRGDNLLDGGAAFYGVFETADKKWIALGSIEEPFWQELITLLGLKGDVLKHRMERRFWPHIRALIGEKIAAMPRDHWVDLLEQTDVCFAPVLTMEEAPDHPHIKARDILQTVDGIVQPAPAPRFNGEKPQAAKVETSAVDYESALASWV